MSKSPADLIRMAHDFERGDESAGDLLMRELERRGVKPSPFVEGDFLVAGMSVEQSSSYGDNPYSIMRSARRLVGPRFIEVEITYDEIQLLEGEPRIDFNDLRRIDMLKLRLNKEAR